MQAKMKTIIMSWRNKSCAGTVSAAIQSELTFTTFVIDNDLWKTSRAACPIIQQRSACYSTWVGTS